MVATAINQSFTTLLAAAGIRVTYARGDANVTVLAVPGSTQYAESTGAGYIETSQTRDYLILATDLKIGGEPVLPERGDTITENVNGVDMVYPVASPGGDRLYGYADPYRQVLRIHTTQTR